MHIGTDIISLKRLGRVFQKFPTKLAHKILSTSEWEVFSQISNDRRRLEFLGGRFCGKEAIFKAAGREDLTWKRVSILRNASSNQPKVFIDDLLVESLKVSISHEEEFAVATAINC